MWSFTKKLISVLIVLYLVALILNLKVGGKPTREWTSQAWNSPGVQKVYRGIRDRITALVRKDISVEEVFKSEIPGAKGTGEQTKKDQKNTQEETRTIDIEKLDEKDREALERILDKSSK